MVVIRSLTAVNFRRLYIPEPLRLERGFVIIRGRNEAGKSTLIEAILFGLFGDHQVIGAIRGNPQRGYAEVVNHRSRRARVEVEFEVEGMRYRVTRELEREGDSIRQVSARLVEVTEGRERTLATTVKAVNDEITRILRVSWREMLSTNVVAQKDLERIIEMSKGDRERIINLMMGLESYNKAIASLEERRRDLSGKARELEARVQGLEKELGELEKLKESLSQWRENLKAVEEELPKVQGKVERLKKTLDYLGKLSQVLERRTRVLDALSSAENLMRELQGRVSSLRKQEEERLADLRDKGLKRQRVAEELDAAEKELERLGRLLDEKRALLEEARRYYTERGEKLLLLERLDREIRELEEELEKLRGAEEELRDAEERKTKLEASLARVGVPRQYKAGVAALGVLSVFSIPFSPLLALVLAFGGLALALLGLQAKWKVQRGLEAQLRSLEGEIGARRAYVSRMEEVAARLEERRRTRGELEAVVRAVEERLKVLSSSLGSSNLEEAVKGLEEEVRKLESSVGHYRSEVSRLRAEALALEEDEKRIRSEFEKLKAELKEAEGKIEELERDVEELRAELDSLSPPEPPTEVTEYLSVDPRVMLSWDLGTVREQQRRLVEEQEKASRRLGELEKERENLEKSIREAEERIEKIEELRAELEKLRAELSDTKLELEAVNRAIEAMREVSRRRREAFAPSVEEYMSWAISFFTGGRYKAVRLQPDTYDIEVYDAEAGRWLRRDIYSGGTNDQFLLAMRVAFTLALLPSTKGSYPRFLVLDEPLGSSDPERRERIMKFFASELTRFFDQIFLITHVDVEEPPGATIIHLEDGRVVSLEKIAQGAEE